MTLRPFVSMILFAGVLALPALALAADPGEKPVVRDSEPTAAGIQVGVCCFGAECAPTLSDEFVCVEQGGAWHPRADCSVCGCSQLAPAGTDCWHTECGTSHYDFANSPLPADFFGPGSLPFARVVDLGSPDPGVADTFIQRLGDMCFDGNPPVVAETPIQLVELNLVSCEPITVDFDSGETVLWNVTVGLDGIQPEGNIFAKTVDATGGTFESTLPVQPKFSFVRLDTGETVATDAGTIPETTLQAFGVRWWQFQPPFEACGPPGFSPGEFDPDRQCCPETCHSAGGTAPHEHCVIPPGCPPCPAVQTGACCDGNTGTCSPDKLEIDCTGDQLQWFPGLPCTATEINCVEHTGACCDGTTGGCEDGVFQGDCVGDQLTWSKNTPCSQAECFEHTGACCDGNTGICEDGVLQSDCVGDQASWFKNTLCETGGTPICFEHTGACCDGNTGRCEDGVLRGDCVGDQLTWSKNTPCSQAECFEHTGACCDGTTGACEDGVRQADCPVNPKDPANQFSWHKGMSCFDPTNNEPLCREHTGACCNDRTGTCASDVPESQCPTSSNPFNPWRWTKGLTCDELDPTCGPRGACCVDGVCLGVITADGCRDEGGSFFEGEECGVCERGPSEPCEHCGITDHWVDDPACLPGVDRLNLSGAKFGLDFDVESDECMADVSVRAHGPTWINFSGPVDDSTWFPGTRDPDNHLDVRDTEIVSMDLVSVDGQVRVTGGWGRGAIPLPHSYGAIAEQPTEPGLADSFFDVSIEIEVVDVTGVVIARLYNREPVRVEAKIDCIPPDANYIHPVGCIPLWTSPIAGEGEHVANLVSAEHGTFEQQGACCDGTTGTCEDGVLEARCPVDPDDPLNQFSWHKETLCADVDCREHTGACCDRALGTCADNVPESRCGNPDEPNRFEWTKDTPCDQLDPPCEPRGACCIDDSSQPSGLGCNGVVFLSECVEKGGLFFEGKGCEACSTEPAEPCDGCGPGAHWLHDPPCPPGVDRLELSGAKFGIDFGDLDCVQDVSVRAHGPAWINLSGPMDDSHHFPGLRPFDGHADVIDTEIVSMELTSPDGSIVMRAGRDQGAMPLLPSLGAMAEEEDTFNVDSFFDVFTEISVNGDALRLYNQDPVRVQAVIDCIAPDATYIHPTDCIPLWTSPNPGEGEHVANLVRAEHRTFEAACFETIGGAVYTDCDSPLTSGEENVAITVAGPGGVFNAVTSGPSGVWSISDVPCGEYTVAAQKVFREYCHVDIGGDCPPEPCEDSTVIDVDPVNRAENLSIQFLSRDSCIRNDMNYDEICTIVFDADLFVQCVYDGDCVGPDGQDLKCPSDCNCDDLSTIVFDADCFVHNVFVKGECGSCDGPDAKSRTKDGRRSGFTIGGAVYDDASNPLFSGVQGVNVQILGAGRRMAATAVTAGPSGIWRVDDLPEGDYTVVIERRHGRVAAGRDVIPITVNAENEAANLSIAVLRDSGPTRPRDVRRDQRPRSK